jgi:folate-dependent phosphoribosylglycinamide formyltransferase PurN
MNIVVWGSGSCSTIEAIVQNQKQLDSTGKGSPYRVAALVTDNQDSKAHVIAAREGIPIIYNDLSLFMALNGLDPSNKKQRKSEMMRTAYDARTAEMLLYSSEQHGFRIDLNCLAGYMLKIYPPITRRFPGRIMNSHPADLSIVDENGRRKYTGDNAVLEAIVAGEKETRTSIHIVRDEVDNGEILVQSSPLKVPEKALIFMAEFAELAPEEFRKNLLERYYESRKTKKGLRNFSPADLRRHIAMSMTAPTYQELQKIRCDYPAYIFAIEETARGNFALEHSGNERMDVFYRSEKMPPCGVRL